MDVTRSAERVRVTRVTYLTATIAALDVALFLSLFNRQPLYSAPFGVVAIAALFAAAEMAPLHLTVGGERHSISFNEVPLALGAVFLGPGLFVAAVVVGSGVALVWQRRQRGAKLIFNLVQLVAQALVVVGIAQLLDNRLATPVAVGLALVVADAVSCILVSLAIACQQGSWRGVVTSQV